jgi:HEAT repeat protein
LGKIGDKSSVSFLKKMMADSEVNVRWDAAVALAKLENASGKRILLDLLNRNYLDSFPNIDEIEQVQAMLVAIQVAPFIQDMELKKSLAQLKKDDPNLKIREAARKALTQFE